MKLKKSSQHKKVHHNHERSEDTVSSEKIKAIAGMSVDQFLASGLDSDEDSTHDGAMSDEDNDIQLSNDDGLDKSEDSDDVEDEEGTSDEENEQDFQQSLNKLKDSDPTFYKFLQENDKDVLQMKDEESDADESEDQEVSEEDESERDSSGLSMAQISRWHVALTGNQAKSALKEVTLAFRTAVQRVSNSAGSGVDDPEVFNSLVRLCLNEVPRAVASILKLESADRDPTKSKRWVQVKGPVKRFLTDVVQLLHSAGSANMQRALLRHLLAMTSYLTSEPRLCSALIGRLVALWSTGEEEVRVLAFVNMYRLTRRNQAALLDTVLMKAYLAYVKNCAFTSPSTWPQIHLMRRSLVELYSLDPAVSYQRAFLYIRQLAIHLRNAKLDKKKFQVVYNWQYVHCLLLWSALIGHDRSDDLRLLLYPLTQIMLGTVNLITTARHYPLRLHVTQALTQLSASTGTFVPVLPLLLQVLHQTDFNKRNTRISMRPLELSCMLRFSEAELKENGFRDGVFDAVLAGLINYLNVECCSLAFPEMVVMARLQLKEFLAKCKVRTYNQRMKELLDRVKEQCEYLEQRRLNLKFELSDHEAVRRWEQERRAESTPFAAFFQSWHTKQQQKGRAKPRRYSQHGGKISVRTAAPVDDSDAGSDDELTPFRDGDEDGHEEAVEGEVAAEDRLKRLESESDEVEDEGDVLEPLKPQKKKQKKSSPTKKRKLNQNKGRNVARVR